MGRYADAHRGFNDLGLPLDRDAVSLLPALGFGNLPMPDGAHCKMVTRPYHLQDIATRAHSRAVADATIFNGVPPFSFRATPPLVPI